jgi:hypothetical protein
MSNSTPSIWVRHAALVFALKTFAAAMLAYAIALWLDMPRPFWAMTTVFITASAQRGDFVEGSLPHSRNADWRGRAGRADPESGECAGTVDRRHCDMDRRLRLLVAD